MSNYSFDGIILASQSPRRKMLMEKMGLTFTVQPSGLVEFPPMGDLPNAYAGRMAMEKAIKVGQAMQRFLVIGADTVVSNSGKIMGKPANKHEASLMLSQLSGKWHEVWTGLCVYNHQYGSEVTKAIKTDVHFREISIAEIDSYIETGEPMDKAGSYAIQGQGNKLVKEIKGSYHNVIGLPTFELGYILNDLGVNLDSNHSETAP